MKKQEINEKTTKDKVKLKKQGKSVKKTLKILFFHIFVNRFFDTRFRLGSPIANHDSFNPNRRMGLLIYQFLLG